MAASQIDWAFAKNEGGRDSGFHDAGVETFKGNFDRYLAREVIQNSLDARLDTNKSVHVKFELLQLKRSEIPDMDGLEATLARCAEFWRHAKNARTFFERAEACAKAKTISALKISDFNTSGVRGSDTEREKEWYNLIRCAGSSSKGGGEGGSFGIGKNAPFAASQMRTVLYSTENTDGEHIFQGVAMLASHKLPNGATAQPTGYLGGSGGASVRTNGQIPQRFVRAERGTDIYVLGFPHGPNWSDDLIYSVLDNFWPAIDFGDLVVSVGEQIIDAKNLASLLDRFGLKEDFTAHLYYRAFKSPTADYPGDLPHLKKISLYFYTGDSELPKRVAMIRRTGMVIFAKPFRSVLPFCGVFVCRNDDGNELLREMEPPRHDVWDPDHPEKGANKKIESEYVRFIRDCIKKLIPADDAKVIVIPGLNRFLPDDDDAAEESFGSEDNSNAETADRSALPEKIESKRIDSRRKPSQPDEHSPIEGDEDTEVMGGEGTSGGEDHKENGGQGEGGGGGGDGEGDSKPTKGGRGGIQSKPSIPIRYRTFAINPAAGVYSATVRAQVEAKPAAVLIWTVGDDQRTPADIKSVRMASGEELLMIAPGVIAPIKLPTDSALKLEIVLREPIRVAMEVSAHEA
jgi:hypothetical protein